MIQDIFPHRLRNEFIPGRAVEAEGLLFLFRDRSLLCRIRDGAVVLPLVRDIEGDFERRYLFALDGVPCYLGMTEDFEAPEGYELLSVRALRTRATGPR